MSEALPNMEDGEIGGSFVKALKLCEENEAVASFHLRKISKKGFL